MNAAEHYREAERLTEAARNDMRTADPDVMKPYLHTTECVRTALSAAHVHATLALAGAVMVSGASEIYPTLHDKLIDAAYDDPRDGLAVG